MSEARTAWGWGLASVDAAGTTLDVWYPELTLGEAPAESDRPNHNFGTLAHTEAAASVACRCSPSASWMSQSSTQPTPT